MSNTMSDTITAALIQGVSQLLSTLLAPVAAALTAKYLPVPAAPAVATLDTMPRRKKRH